jgi:hypothetical protein
MSDTVLSFIKSFQQGNNGLFIFVLIAVSIALGVYVVVILGTRSANKIIRDREMESTRVIFNNIYANICRRLDHFKDIPEEDAFVYIFAGEQNFKTYEYLVPIVRNFLDKVLEKTKKIKIVSVAGKKLMVKKMDDDFTKIHPSMSLLSHPKYKDHLEFFLVTDCRLPYHFFYSPLAESGVAEVPHRELSTPINWMFENKEEYKTLFRNWLELLKKRYDMHLLWFKGKKLCCKDVHSGAEKKCKNKSDLFFVKSVYLKIKTYLQNETLEQCAYHSDKTGLLMRNWHPFSEDLFTSENKKILLSA